MLKKTLKFIYPYIKPHLPLILLGLLCNFLMVIALAKIPRTIQLTLRELETSSNIVDGESLLASCVIKIILFAIFAAGLGFATRLLIIGSAWRIEFKLRDNFFSHLMSLSVPNFDKKKIGDIMSRAIDDINEIRMLMGPAIMFLSQALFLGPVAIYYMIKISWTLTILAVMPLLLIAVITKIFAGNMYRISLRIRELMADVSSKSQENFANIKLIKAYSQSKHEIEEFEYHSEEFKKVQIHFAKVRGLFHSFLSTLANLGILLFVIFSPGVVLAANIKVSDAFAFFAYQEMLIWPMIALGWTIMLIQRGAASIKRFNDVFNENPVIQTPENAVKPEKIFGEIEFRNVNFAYESKPSEESHQASDVKAPCKPAASSTPEKREAGMKGFLACQPGMPDKQPEAKERRPALQNVTFKIRAGEKVGFLGAVGSGKSTIASLIPRLYDVTEGNILIDNVDVRNYDISSLRGAIGYVPQDSFLFSQSIAENISYAFNEPLSDEKIEAFARITALDKDKEQFPDGYHTVIGERGVSLSGGQKQRTALARAIATDPAILILDDTFSAVDSETESTILDNFEDVAKDKTVIIISHRVSTVSFADKIYVLDDGHIAEEGSPEELQKVGGIYARIARKQQIQSELEML